MVLMAAALRAGELDLAWALPFAESGLAAEDDDDDGAVAILAIRKHTCALSTREKITKKANRQLGEGALRNSEPISYSTGD